MYNDYANSHLAALKLMQGLIALNQPCLALIKACKGTTTNIDAFSNLILERLPPIPSTTLLVFAP